MHPDIICSAIRYHPFAEVLPQARARPNTRARTETNCTTLLSEPKFCRFLNNWTLDYRHAHCSKAALDRPRSDVVRFRSLAVY